MKTKCLKYMEKKLLKMYSMWDNRDIKELDQIKNNQGKVAPLPTIKTKQHLEEKYKGMTKKTKYVLLINVDVGFL